MSALASATALFARRGVAWIATHRFLRFLLVGAMNTAFGYGAFYLAMAAISDRLLAVAFSTALGALFNFHSIGALVFRCYETRLLLRFLCGYATLFLVNALALELVCSQGLSPALAQAVLVGPLALLSYFMNASLVFISRRHGLEETKMTSIPATRRQAP